MFLVIGAFLEIRSIRNLGLMPDSVIKAVKEGFEEIGSEIGKEAKKAVTDIAADIPEQVFESSDNQNQDVPNQEIKPPTDEEVVKHLYGVTGKPKLTRQQVARQQNTKAISDARRKAQLRQALKALNQKPAQEEPTVIERLEMEKQQQLQIQAEKKKGQLPVLIQPSAAPKKGIFGGLLGKKSRKAVTNLQTSTERRSTGGGIA